ncbi:hypothetical protein MRX96_008808 [Rhipicephalus microplus]
MLLSCSGEVGDAEDGFGVTPHRSPTLLSSLIAITLLPMDSVARCVVETVDVNAKLLNDLQASIWRVPEVRFEEKRARNLVTEELHKAGFQVRDSVQCLDLTTLHFPEVSLLLHVNVL